MPTASQFDDVARELDDIAVWAGGPLTAIGCARHGVAIGGWVADLIERAVLEAIDLVDVVAAGCRDAAIVARQRADACRRYTEELRAYRAELERREAELAVAPELVTTIRWPERPPPPGPWAEEG